ncbi:hypothetical protein RJ639_024539 [Escallonia herrerae]|uniref:Protein misato homolog 1 n=1 Tax=Escallonia herrerae TaxID=1293975 RepID=A0AA89AEJ5_9ASTE|nr:hypothetical protein RJ639_024539 [Escallonia herrerae]
MREIVTLQVGTYANFIGSHFWNFQGILTYTPRLVSVDFQGSLGSMSSRGTLYRNIPSGPSDVVTCPQISDSSLDLKDCVVKNVKTGNVSIHASEPRKKNLFLQSLDEDEPERVHNEPQSKVPDKDIVESLENDVQFWTDYSKVHYHPQSLYELNGQCMDSQEFNNYGIGRDAFSRGLQGEEINERLRFFIEECDHIQGIQFMVDNTGGFSGVAAEFLESIADEFTNVPVLLYAVQAPESYTNARGQKQTISLKLHDAVSFSRLSSLSKLIVPVGLPSLSRSDASRFLCIKDEKLYHSSAVYASAIHSISLPFRMKRLGPTGESCYGSGAMDVYEVIQMLAGQARQNRVTILDVAMPAPSLSGKQAAKFLLRNLQPLTPETAEDMEDLQAVESMSIHGVLGHGGHQASFSEVKDSLEAASEHAMTRPMFSHLSVTTCPLPIPLPFPSIFGNLVGEHGELLSSPNRGSLSRGSLDVESIPMAARLRSSSAILPFLENRLANLRKYGLERGALGSGLVRSWGFEKDELDDMGEVLSKMIVTLDPRSQASSDSD